MSQIHLRWVIYEVMEVAVQGPMVWAIKVEAEPPNGWPHQIIGAAVSDAIRGVVRDALFSGAPGGAAISAASDAQ